MSQLFALRFSLFFCSWIKGQAINFDLRIPKSEREGGRQKDRARGRNSLDVHHHRRHLIRVQRSGYNIAETTRVELI